MDFDLVLRNIRELNEIAGEGQHFIKRTKDGARLEVRMSLIIDLIPNELSLLLLEMYHSSENKVLQYFLFFNKYNFIILFNNPIFTIFV